MVKRTASKPIQLKRLKSVVPFCNEANIRDFLGGRLAIKESVIYRNNCLGELNLPL